MSMFTVYPTKMKAMISMHKEFESLEHARAYVNSRKNPENYSIESEGVFFDRTATISQKVEKPAVEIKNVSSGQKTGHIDKNSIDFTGAIEINRLNVKYFYNKSGYIKVVSPSGITLHVGKTKNMGKVFSNYVNCAKYNQSYDFNLENGDRLLFKESEL